MPRVRLNIDDARKLDFQELSDRGYAMLESYAPPEGESEAQLEARISKALDELPDVYGWFLQLHSFFDHWAVGFATMYGMKSTEYLDQRIKRDLMDDLAKVAKLRYDATSRRLTQAQLHQDEAGLSRGRK